MRPLSHGLTLCLFLASGTVHAAPLSGAYTLGGAAPDFASFTDATSALNAEGVDGDVTFFVRPGTYEPAIATEPILYIPQPIVGVAVNRPVTFRPDIGSGGTVDNVVLQVTTGAASIPNALMADIRSDYVRVEDMTFVFADSSVVGRLNRDMVSYEAAPGVSSEIRGATVRGCKFIGSTATGRAQAAIQINSDNYDTVIEGNDIANSTTGIAMPSSNSIYTTYDARIENNSIRGMSSWITGGSSEVGFAVELSTSFDSSIRGNTIDYRGGATGQYGIKVRSPARLTIDGNTVIGASGGNGVGTADNFAGIHVFANGAFTPQSATVTNNMVSRVSAGFAQPIGIVCDSVLVAHNTVYGWPRAVSVRSGPFSIDGTRNTVINNLFIELADHPTHVFAMVIADTAGNTFDYNDLYVPGGQSVRLNLTNFSTLAAWQATGNDLNSIELLPQFVNNISDLHLEGCSPSDPALRGSGAANVWLDFDGEARAPFDPVIGADETSAIAEPNLDVPLKYLAGQSAWLMTSALVDNDSSMDLIFTNTPFGGSNDVTVLFNDGSGSFGTPVHVPAVNQPNIVKAGHLNNDAFTDIVVSSEISDSLVVLFGTGGGGFGPPVRVDDSNAVTDFELVDYDDDNDVDIIMLVSPAADSGYVNIRINDGNGNFTWNNVAAAGVLLDDLEIGFFNSDIYPDLAISDAALSSSITVLLNLGVVSPGISNGFAAPVSYFENVYSVPQASRFMVGDFDGDQIVDLLLGDSATLDSLVLLKGNGDGTFASRRGIYVSSDRTIRVATALDFENDGDLDVVTGNSTSDLHLLLNDGFGNFELQYICNEGLVHVGAMPRGILATALDGDAIPDVAILTTADTVEVLKNVHFATVGIEKPAPIMVPGVALSQNVPNPARTLTTIAYRLPHAMHVRLEVFNVAGQRVALLVNAFQTSGPHSVRLDARRLPSGVYFYRLAGDALAASRKLLLVR